MKSSLLCATLLLLLNHSVQAADAPLSERAPIKAITEARATAAIREMDFYFESELGKTLQASEPAQQAETLRQQAKRALATQDYVQALRLANNAIAQFHNTSPAPTQANPEQQAYQQQLSRVNTLLAALKQATRDSQHPSDSHIEHLQQQLEQAKQTAAKPDYPTAIQQLEQISLASRLNISALLSGSVLHAEKDTSPEGIYQYELFRNSTYRSLLDLLYAARNTASYTREDFFQQQEKQGDQLQQAALELAAQQQYPQAAEKLIESTSAYKYAVRRSGIIIPD